MRRVAWAKAAAGASEVFRGTCFPSALLRPMACAPQFRNRGCLVGNHFHLVVELNSEGPREQGRDLADAGAESFESRSGFSAARTGVGRQRISGQVDEWMGGRG